MVQSMQLPTRKLVGEHVLSEANETRSREHVYFGPLVAALSPGTVLGRVVEGTQSVVGANVAGMVGNSTFTVGPTADADAAAGVYRGMFLDADTIELNGPNGHHAIVQLAAAYNGPVNFTRTAGATPHAAGDEFQITVSYAGVAGLVVPWDPAGVNGSENFAGVLFDRARISAANQRCVAHVRSCELNEKKLTFVNVPSGPQLIALRAQAKLDGVLFSGGR